MAPVCKRVGLVADPFHSGQSFSAGFVKQGIDAMEVSKTITPGEGWRYMFLVGALSGADREFSFSAIWKGNLSPGCT